MALAIEQPAFGQVRIDNELRKRGLPVSPAGVRMLARRESEDLAAQGGFVSLSGGPSGMGGNSGAFRANSGVLIAQVPGGSELCLYYLSDEYHELSSGLRDSQRA
mgnify:CR=1 FL=1